jgi:DNA-binding transcriptional ArsR family regulator
LPRRNGHGIDLLADPTRRRIVSLLALGTGHPSDIAAELGLSPQAISRQLGILRRAGLITVRRGYADRRWLIYFIEPRKLGQITAWLAGTEVGRVFPTERARKSWLDAILPLERKDPEDAPDRETGNSPN